MPVPRDFRYQLVNHRPSNDFKSPEDWDGFVTDKIEELFRQEPASRGLEAGTSEYEALFDDYVIFQVETMGPMMTLSRLVQWQMHCWTFQENGPEKFRRFGDALATFALILQRKRKLPIIDPEWYPSRKTMIQELTLLLARLSDFAKTQRERVPVAKFADLAASYLDEHDLPLLSRNRENLLDYLKSGADGWTAMLNDSSQKVGPAQFFDTWWAHRLGRDSEALRQTISKLGSAKI